MSSAQWNSQSEIRQASAYSGKRYSDLGLTDQTSSPMTVAAFNDTWNGTVEAMAHIAPVPAQSQVN